MKIYPLINELKRYFEIKIVVSVTGQHRQMLDHVLEAFGVMLDYDLSIMKEKQTLCDITTNILNRICGVLSEVKLDIVLVYGGMTSSFVKVLVCFYRKIPVGHIEARLCMYNVYSCYLEEFNRQVVSIISRYNFATTKFSKENLIREGKDTRYHVGYPCWPQSVRWF